jgi:hypothetical protein
LLDDDDYDDDEEGEKDNSGSFLFMYLLIPQTKGQLQNRQEQKREIVYSQKKRQFI